MEVSLVPVISGRAGGAAGRERSKTNARQREMLQVQRYAEVPYGTGQTAEICCAARVVGAWDEPLERFLCRATYVSYVARHVFPMS